MRLILVRHAESVANVDGALSTVVPGPLLSAFGRQQADALAEAFAGTPLAGIYASTMRRAQHTAFPLAQARGVPVRIIEGLQEIEAGDDEGAVGPAAMRRYRGAIARWASGDLLARVPGAGTGVDAVGRFDEAIAAIRARHDADATVIVVSHSISMRVWVGTRASNLSPAYAAGVPLGNCGSIDLRIGDRADISVERWQDRYPPFTARAAVVDPFEIAPRR